MAHGVADEEHDEQFGECGDGTCGTHLLKFLDAEFQSQCEHQEDDADVAPYMHTGGVAHHGEPLEVGANEEAGQDVAEHEGLFEPFEDDGDNAGGDQD